MTTMTAKEYRASIRTKPSKPVAAVLRDAVWAYLRPIADKADADNSGPSIARPEGASNPLADVQTSAPKEAA